MREDLNKRVDSVCEALHAAIEDYNLSTKCVLEALTGIHERLEKIEKWIESVQNEMVKP